MRKSKVRPWSALAPRAFEELIFWLLHREGFFNVAWHGASGNDKGRDVVCQRTDLLGTKVIISDCVVQCKKYTGAVPRQRLLEDAIKAMEHQPDYFIVATSAIVSSSAKDWLRAHEERLGFRLVLWERTDLEILLERHQDLRYKFLRIPAHPHFFLHRLASDAQHISNIERFPIAETVKDVLARSAQLAMNYSNLMSLGHVLVSLLRTDRQCARPLFLALGIEPDPFADLFEREFVKTQPEVDVVRLGLQVSLSVRLTLESATKLSSQLGEAALSDRTFLWSLISQRSSGTMEFLEKDCRLSRESLMDHLSKQFSEWERQNLGVIRARPIESTTRPKPGVLSGRWRWVDGRLVPQ